MVKIATWNINSIRSRLSHVLEYIRNEKAPDVLLLQELKCPTEKFPYIEIEDAGYNISVNGQKTYNGVAILSKFPLEDVKKELPGDSDDNQTRYIEGIIVTGSKALRVASVYAPNGNMPGSEKFRYKMDFFDRLYNHISKLMNYNEVLIIGGDYNIAPSPIDVYDAEILEGRICFHKDERKKFRSLLGLGMVDIYRALNENKQEFSWWDYRGGAWQKNKGMRIDHLLLSPEAVDLAAYSAIDKKPRNKEKPSDHTPVWCELEGLL